MNERIKELLKQSGLQPYYDAQEGQFEKFAELIVRECADIAAKNQAENMNWDIAEIIKEHFGVEE